MANGDRLTGTLLRGVGATILFKSEVAGELMLPLAKVRELHSGGSFAVLRKGGPVRGAGVNIGTVAVQDGQISIRPEQGEPVTFPVGEAAYIVDRVTYERELSNQPGLRFGWTGAVTAGASFVRSTNNGSTFNGALTAVRALPTVPWLPARSRTSVNVTETYGQLSEPVIPPTTPPTPNAEIKTSIFHAGMEQDRYFNRSGYALTQMMFDHNYSQGLQLSQSYGAGLGCTLIKQARQQLDVKGDLHYLQQGFQTPASNQDLVGSTFAEVYTLHLPHKMALGENAAVLPEWNDSDALSANASVSYLLPLFRRFSFTMTVTDSFLNDPPQYYKTNSFVFATGMTYSFK